VSHRCQISDRMAPLAQTQVLPTNFGGQNFHEQISHMEQNKQLELMAGQLLYLNENPEQRSSLENLDSSFNLGHNYHGYNYDQYSNSGYQHSPSEFNRRDSGCFMSRGVYEADHEVSWSPHNKYNNRHSHNLQAQLDFMNNSRVEDIPFTEDDFPSLSKDNHSSPPKHVEKQQSEVKDGASNNHVWESLIEANLNNKAQDPSDGPGQDLYRPQTEPGMFQLPMFSPPHQGFFNQSVMAWNSRKMFHHQTYPPQYSSLQQQQQQLQQQQQQQL